MDHEFIISTELQLVLEIIGGEVNLHEMRKAGEQVGNEPDFQNTLNQLTLVDRNIDIQLSGDDIRSLSHRLAAFSKQSLRAFFVPDNPLAFGLGRMFEQERGGSAGVIGIFTDFDEACEFVGTTRADVLRIWPSLIDQINPTG